jgi:hypothetical protein
MLAVSLNVMSDVAEYCRQLEAYLCQKNGGHLIRIAGPAFDRVVGWAEQGVPLKIAYGGIDRYCERQQGKSGRRRPVRIEFCEHDILALFDDWRRAVGVVQAGQPETATPRKPGLASHLDRVVARLVGRRTARSSDFERAIERVLTALDPLTADARHARGDARAAIVEQLAVLDAQLMEAAIADLDPADSESLTREAQEELAGFGSRLSPDARVEASRAAFERLVREALALPVVRYG